MSLFWHEPKGELLLYLRSRELAFFTFLLPMILFVLLGSAYGTDSIDGYDGATFLLAGMIGYGAISVAFAGLAIVLVIRREAGVLKRLRATPLPAPAYVTALLSSYLVAFAVEVVVLIALGKVLFGVEIPDQIPSLVLALLLGVIAFCALGIAVAAVIRSAEGASAAVNAIYLPMAFISGSFFSAHSFPGVLRGIAALLPLTYFIKLVRAIMLDGDAIWTQGTNVAVLAAWGLAGVIVAVRAFRWEPHEG